MAINLLINLTESDTITVVRVIGEFTVVPIEDPTAGYTVQGIDAGIQVVTAEAFAAGVFSDPDQNADTPARGWVWRTRLTEMTDTTNNVIDTWNYPTQRFDVRAARRVDRGILAFVVDKNAQVGVVHDVRISGILRVLCLT